MAIKKKQKVRRRGARREAKNKSHGAHKNHWAERKTITKRKAAISHKKRGSETATKTRKKIGKKIEGVDIKKKQEFICPACGYEAYKMAGYSHCPLCIICRGCQKTVRRCSCREKE